MDKERYRRAYDLFLFYLVEFRRGRQMTQSELAAKLGWTQADISKVENGVRRLDVIELLFWLEALGDDLPSFAAQLCFDLTDDPSIYD